MIFHVTFIGGERWVHRTFERGENAFAEMANHVCEDIQTATMGHPQLNVLDAEISGAFDQTIKQGHDRLATFERESLLAEELSIQKALELLSGNQFPKNLFPGLDINRFGLNKLPANLFAQPKFFFLALNVSIFDTNLATVSPLQDIQDLAQRSRFSSPQPAGDEQTIEIPNREVVSLDI